MDVFAGIIDVIPQELGAHGWFHDVGLFVVQTHQVLGQFAVRVGVGSIQDEIDQIESTQKGRRQLDVFYDAEIRIVPRFNGIRGRQDRCARVQTRNDPRLCNGHRLLFHGLVQYRPRGIRHLVEFIDAADTAIGQDEGTALQDQIAGFRVTNHRSRETHSRTPFSRRVYTTRAEFVDVTEQLRLGSTRITTQQDVNVSAFVQFGIFVVVVVVVIVVVIFFIVRPFVVVIVIVVVVIILAIHAVVRPSLILFFSFLGFVFVLYSLVVSAKHHAQDPLLYVVQFPNGGRE
mmetsp:Transcript_13172/g.26438  ORF Transcript_13172/g.26438 Transcript_13172/m.26438 type:complete len:288 (+) Transcript_13172:1033-1896(+)